MSNEYQYQYQYQVSVVKDQYGAVDVNFYAQQASEMRSQYVLSSFKSLFNTLKNAISLLKNSQFSVANILYFRKFSK